MLVVFKFNSHFQALGKDKEGHEDKRAIFAFQELLADLRLMFRKQIIELDKTKKYPLPAFIVASSSLPSEIPGTVRDNFVHRIELPGSVDKNHNSIKPTIEWFLQKYGLKFEETGDMGGWIEKSCRGGLQRSFADYAAVLSFATR